MPYLRPLELDSRHELRSSKTLIGSGTSTCDLVISGDNILELHALLNLSTDKASATLVPFSTTSAGACYVNDVVVPREGTVVVHGDRVAFGNPRNVFVFELMPHPHITAVSQRSIETEKSVQHSTDQAGGNQAFRKALDTLRGDRRTSTVNASVAASIQNNLQAARSRSSVSSFADSTAPSLKCKEQLSKFLLEASTDSLLSDYVERKLNQRRSRQSSTASSRRVSSGVQQSRVQRNLVEVEKLRLSQRIREVNDVLNGDMEFQESYLTPSSISRKPRGVITSNMLSNRGESRSDEDSYEDEDDELPVMIERVKSPTPANLSASIMTEHSDQENVSNPPSQEEGGAEREQLEHSLRSMPASETTPSQQFPDSPSQSYSPPKVHSFFSKAMELGFNDLTRSHSRPINTARQKAAKTALQEKLINQTIRRKKNEIMSEVFVRWIRGLRIQNQNRERKARQLGEVRKALGKLRRDQYFIRWRDFASLSNQVIVCRIEAFQQRSNYRLTRKCWAAIRLHCLSIRQRSTLLRGLIVKKAVVQNHSTFRRWQQFAQRCSIRNQLGDIQRVEHLKLDAHLERMSERHYNQRILKPLLAQVLQKWKMTADRHKKQQLILLRVLVHGTLKLTGRALRKWKEVATISRYSVDLKKQTEQQIKESTDRLTNQHDQAQLSLQESHAHQLQKLLVAIEEKDREVEQLERQQRADNLGKTAAKRKWEQELRKFFEGATIKCDEEIAQTSEQLEKLLQSAENDVLGARFGAAQFLVDSILQQKIRNANESTRFQEAVRPYIKHASAHEKFAHDPISGLSSNVHYLYDMLQQVNNFFVSAFLSALQSS
ncbi:hypothetical protein F441_15749 [Phytophthora nicotianae CJ01A1]|uniref:FHA domain-containing protein n=4 Tax=Phytophthora nicotianae TaxID=4792 RepID=V9EGG2_PHYNI|nr:hypothetical protein F443_15913 [Phytophthora nicotianae P1569]ETK78554.1 hypothetical protein L915_15467 [Phytophthora nicotianae]ETP08195.1 hypothetical protein F441_15749 [Phytophthora nicotianae CJ01A1]ETP36249.1 hypothetical protein F442_15758 [Phytophthora nicotianae P10297]ETL31965.1 hypothetical protein L916_15362 [Phytophthora nicotianae]